MSEREIQRKPHGCIVRRGRTFAARGEQQGLECFLSLVKVLAQPRQSRLV
jgi:hypothetical protein